MTTMKEMMKRCLSLGFSLPVIVLTGFRNGRATAPAVPLPAPNTSPSAVPAAAAPEMRPLASFSGTVVRDGSRFALRDADGALFALSSTGRAWPFEGEDVQVSGQLDSTGTVLHILAIHAIDDLRAEAV
jgi:hypothetical protein